jgi:hypothetical protein
VAEVISDINIGLAMVADGQAFAYCQYLGCCDEKEYLDAEYRAYSGWHHPRRWRIAMPSTFTSVRRMTVCFRKKSIYLQILRWETFLDAISETRLQEEYNKEVRNCDIFASLFKTKTGKYMEEEFDAAHRAFKDSGKPLIYIYFMETNIPNDKRLRGDLISPWSFQYKLSELGRYLTHYISIEDLKLKFQLQLDKLIEERKI